MLPYMYPIVEPRPLHPNATPSERMEYQRQMEAYRAAIRERNQMMDWDMAVHLVAAAVVVIIALAGMVIVIHHAAGVRGLAIAVSGLLLLALAVVEVKRRL